MQLKVEAAYDSHRPTSPDEITVVTENLPPYQIVNSDGSLDGYATEVIKALFELTKDKAKFEVLPWARAYNKALWESNVLIYSLSKTKDRENKFHWVGPLHYQKFYFWGLSDKFAKPVNSVDSLKDLPIAYSTAYNSAEYLQSLNFSKTHKVSKNDQALSMLYKGRVDTIVLNDLMLKLLQKNTQFHNRNLIKLYEAAGINGYLNIAFSKNTDPAMVRRFQLAYAELERNGKLKEIREKWADKLEVN